MASRDGYFAPESAIRRIGNSPVTPFLGGGAAVLLQVAHPLVAAGVAEHSNYQRHLWTRLMRTLRALYLITYGTREEADAVGETVRAVHARVRGETAVALGRFPAGTPYSASDPELMLWVHATLVATSLSAYQRYEGALARDDQERYYERDDGRRADLRHAGLGHPAHARRRSASTTTTRSRGPRSRSRRLPGRSRR